MHRLLLAALVPLALGDYYAPTMTPTASVAPKRADTYAPTDAPSYAPKTDTYSPTLGSCPPLGDYIDSCPSTRLLIQMGLPLCSEVGLAMFDYCITGPQICPDQPGPTNCPAFQVARRLLKKIHGPMVPSWAQRPYKKATAGDEAQRRLATPAECADGVCFVAEVGGTSLPTTSPTAGPTASPTSVPSAMPTNAPSAGPTASPTAAPTTASPTAAPTAGPTPGPTPRDCTKRDTCECGYQFKIGQSGCKITNAVDFPGCACKCRYNTFRCTGKDANCKDPESDACKNPDKSKASCIQGGGACGGYW